MNFIIFNLNNGSKKSCNLANLSQSLSPNCEIVRIIGDKHEAVGFVSHALLVHFAVENAHYAYQNYSKLQDPRIQNCIDLIKKWVKDQSSVSFDQLKEAAAAAYAANDAYNAAAYAAAYTAAYYAAYAAHDAAYAAANAAYAAAYAAYAAAYAADAAYAAGKNKQEELIRQGNFILKHFGAE